jgi:hypothetical protein
VVAGHSPIISKLLEYDLPDPFLVELVQFFQAALDVVYEDN